MVCANSMAQLQGAIMKARSRTLPDACDLQAPGHRKRWICGAGVGRRQPVHATRTVQAPIARKSASSFFTASHDFSNAAFSSGVNSTSSTRSAPPAPITTGTPT